MKKIFAGTPHTKFIAAASVLTWAIAMANSADAAQLQEARVTQVVNDVKLLLEQAAPRPAAISDLIRHGTAVRTGTQSRSELTFSDLTITRLGANTIFSFKEGTREMTLIDGAILFQVPKGSGGATIRTVGVTAAITGTTGIAEFHPATASHPQLSKWLCLEGTFHLYLPNGQSVELGPGKMATADGKSFSKVRTFDIAKLTSTSLFFTGFDQPLASMNLIMLESQNQVAGSLLAGTTNPLDPTRIVNVTSQAIVAEETPPPSVSPTVTPPPPTPSKFGTPSVISSPNPYLITNGTVITTDPSITTNGVTDYGKIYRGQSDDGAFSLWAFGSTSAFDTALRIDNIFFADPSHLPIAVFKFENLSLTGEPTIDTTNGVTKLGLIGVDAITSGPPGGTLTFTGLDLLLLATVNGSINLTSNVSFQDLHELVMYARGAGSDLTINSPISNIAILGLVAEDSLHLSNPGTMTIGKLDAISGGDLVLQIGGSLLLNGRVRLDSIVLPGASVASGVNLTLNVAGDYTNNSATESSRLAITNRDRIGTGGNIGVNIGGDLTAMNDFNLVVQNTSGQIDNGGNITLEVGGDINVAGALDATLDNSNTGQIGGNALINLGVSGDINNTGGTLIQVKNELDSGVSATHGGTIGGDSSITVTASNMSTQGFFVSLLNENDRGGTGTAGGHIGGAASIAINVNGALTTRASNPNPDVEPGAFDLFIENYGFGDGSSGGFIGSNASVSVAAASISTATDFNIGIDNSAGGTIGGAARLNVTAGSMSVDEFSAGITNGNLNVTTESRPAGHVTGAASITLNVTGAFNVAGGTDNDMDEPSAMAFQIDNRNFSGSPGGSIGSDASIDVTAGSISDNGGALRLRIFNSGSGIIGGNALITVGANSISAAGPGIDGTGENLTLLIDNSAAGNINGGATISLDAGSVSTAGSFNAIIRNSSAGSIGNSSGGGAAINFGLAGALTSHGDANFTIDNSNGGTIGGNATIGLAAANISVGTVLTPADLDVFIGNTSGTIGGSVATNFNVSGDITVAGAINAFLNNGGATSSPGSHIRGDATIDVRGATGINAGNGAFFGIVNEDAGADTFGGTIDGNALVHVTADHLSTEALAPGDFNLFGTIHNRGGMVGGNCDVTFDIASAITTAGRASFDILNFDDGGVNGGGMIGGAATVSLNASALSIDGELLVDIQNQNSGTINSNGNVSLSVGGNLTATDLNIFINNFSTGTIGGDAAINMTAHNISTGGSLFADIFNYSGGSIGGGAMLDVTAANITANSLVAQIDNTGGSIGASTDGGATINMNVSGAATVSNDATVAIYGSDGAVGGAGININGGNYNVGGTFLSYIDGNGTITFNNASAHADVLKAGVFGANGVLNVGGGTLSADSTLKLYAPGSNGQLNFISNVTLGGNSLKILAANSITIFNNVVVTIGGSKPADVYTGFTGEIPNANYTGFGGNGSTTGTFGGAGANDPQPIEKAPPFNSTNHVTSPIKPGGGGKATNTTINIRSSDELLALLDRASRGPGGKITVPPSKNTNNPRNSSRIAAAGQLNVGNRLNINRRAMDMRTTASSVMRHSPQ